MKKSVLIGATMLASALCSGCGDSYEAAGGSGGIVPDLALTTELIVGEASRSSAVEIITAIKPEDLKIDLVHADGKHAYSYNNIDEFPSGSRFPVGRYTLTASYQGTYAEGFEYPLLKGETELTVYENRDTPVSVTAKLANAVVNISFSDRLKEYFTYCSADVTSSTGGSWSYTTDETRPLFVAEGSTTVGIEYTKPNGTTEHINVVTFNAQPQHLYKVALDIDNTSGVAMLNVSYDGTITQDPISIDLSKDISVVPAPYLLAKGFDPDKGALDMIEYIALDQDLDIQAIAMGGLSKLLLVTKSNYLNNVEAVQDTIELLGASDADRLRLTNLGLSVIGVWNNPGNMAALDFAGILPSIHLRDGDGNTKFTVIAEDRYGRRSNPMTLELNVITLQLNITSTTEFALGTYEDVAHLHLNYNGGLQLKDKLSFEYKDQNGNWVKTDTVEVRQTPADFNPDYDGNKLCALIKVPGDGTPQALSDITVRAICGRDDNPKKYISNEATFKRVGPFLHFEETFNPSHSTTFAWKTDLHLLYGVVKLETIKILGSTDGGATWSEYQHTAITTPAAQQFTVTGLKPATTYLFKATANGNTDATADKTFESDNTFEITTESPLQLPNSNMEQWYRQPGQTNYWWIDFPGADINAVWGTMNQLTTSVGDGKTGWFDHKGCSYCAFSGTRPTGSGFEDRGIANGSANHEVAHTGNYAAVISTVGWGDNDGNGGTSVGKGCKNLTVGELYLGYYDSSSKSAVYSGYVFGSRPSGMSFWYYYCKKNSNDYALAQVQVLDASGNVIASGEFRPGQNEESTTSYRQATIPLTYIANAQKAALIKVVFKSSDNSSCHSINTTNLSTPDFSNLSTGRFTGSELFIDDIELLYN